MPQPNRRQMLAASSVLAAGVAISSSSAGASESPAHGLKKAVKIGMVGAGRTLLEKFQLVKRLGFDGIELNSPNKLKVDDVLAAQEKSGLPVHGVVDSVHWKQALSHPEAKVRAAGLTGLKTALRDAKSYGASSVLLVPAVVNKQVAYAEAYTRSQAEIRKALPLAQELGISILVENVWNNFLLSPVETAHYIDELNEDLKRPLVGAYFDVGNVVRYGWPEHWIAVLGKRVVKLDIKEYSRKLQNSKGPRAGFGVKLGEGDCDWPAVMQALKAIGYKGWATAEVRGGNAERLKDVAARMDRIFAS